MKLSFQWNGNKAQTNLRKHKISFEEAKTIFEDPLSSTIADPLHSEYESRFVQIGMSSMNKILVVVFTDRNDSIRIISARKATKQEVKKYEKE